MNCGTIEFLELSNEILSKGNYLRFRARGGSMYPFIRSDEVIQVKPVKISEINYADIIFYHIQDNRIAVHRVIKKSNKNGKIVFLTKGDSVAGSAKDRVYPENILGKVVAIERNGKTIRIDKGFLGIINILYIKLLPFSKYLYLLLKRLGNLQNCLRQKCKKYSKEDELIFLFVSFCSNLNNEESKKNQVENLLKSSLNWDYIFKKLKKNGLSFLIYYHLNRLKFNGYIPSSILEQMERGYYANCARNAVICEEVKKVLKAFNEENIKAIVLKGVFLAENIYKNIALRPMADVDILVKEEDVLRANEVLNSLDYPSALNYKNFFKRPPVSSINTLIYRSRSNSHFFIHLHWHLINSTRPLDFLVRKIDMGKIFSSAQATKIDGVDTLTLSPNHLLIYLSHHNLRHSFDKLILLSDILAILRYYKGRINWDLVIEDAERFNLSLVLYYVLCFVSKMLRFEIPELEKLSPAKFGFSEKMFLFFINKGSCSYGLSYFIYLFIQRGSLHKLRFIGRTIFPSSYVMAHSFMLPIDKRGVFHYYKRIVNNIFKFLRT